MLIKYMILEFLIIESTVDFKNSIMKLNHVSIVTSPIFTDR